MHYKVEGALRRNKKYFIIFAILWLFIAIVLIVPITLGYNIATQQDGGAGMAAFVEAIKNPFKGFAELALNKLMPAYLKTLGGFTLIFAIFFNIGVAPIIPIIITTK